MNIMLSGFSGSGKTTLARHISESFGMQQVISSDTIHARLRSALPWIFLKWETDIGSISYKLMQVTTKVVQAVDMLVKSRSTQGVVYDACNLQQGVREKMWKILGKNTILVHVTASERTLRARLSRREHPEVWMELLDRQMREFDSDTLSPDIVYDSSRFSLRGDFVDFDAKLAWILGRAEHTSDERRCF